MTLKLCPKPMPAIVKRSVRALLQSLVNNDLCVRPEPAMLKKWDRLIDAWIKDKTMPLYVRKSDKNRGAELTHEDTKRKIIPADNGPAHWSMINALEDRCFSLQETKKLVNRGGINIAMVPSEREMGNSNHKAKPNRCLNKAGWSLRHIDDVKLKAAHGIKLAEVPIAELEDHFRRFISPSNMFLVPKEYCGLGEFNEMKALFRNK